MGNRRHALTWLLPVIATLFVAAGPCARAAEARGESSSEEDADGARLFWRPLVADHWRHVALVVGASIVNSQVDSRYGPRESPLLFGDPPGLDREIRERYRRRAGDTSAHGFVESHVTPLTRGIAAASIIITNAARWRDDVTDFLGLWEAQRFNVATTGLVKNLVGRERPELEFAAEDGASPPRIRKLDRSDSNHQSFYSYHASSAFTTLAYTDRVLTRRLAAHPAARRWSRTGLFTLGAYIAWSRVLQDGHYFTDVLAGSFAGAFTGRSFYSFNHPDGIDHPLSWDPLASGTRARTAPAALPAGTITGFTPGIVPGGAAISVRLAL